MSPDVVLQFGAFLLAAFVVRTIAGRSQGARRRAEVSRKEAERAERRFRSLVDGVEGVIWEGDAQKLRMTFVSQQVESLLGYPVGSWLEESDFWENVIVPEDRASVVSAYAETVRHGRRRELEYRVVAADGRMVWVRHLMHTIQGDHGSPTQAQGLLVDITERKQAEVRERFLARASRELGSSLDYEATLPRVAQAAVEGFADACAIEVLEENGSVRLVSAVRGTPARIDGILQATGRARRADEQLRDVLEQALALGRAVYSSDVSTAFLEKLLDNSGNVAGWTKAPASALAVPLVARERTLGALALISKGKSGRHGPRPEDTALAMELARRTALAIDNARLYREAQRAVRVREEILATTSHELRTPLSHIKGFVSTLRQPDVTWDEETRQDFLAEIERETDRLSGLVSDLLDMSAIESGGLAGAEKVMASPREIVERGIGRVRASLAERTLEIDVPDDLPHVEVDTPRLEQVVANLIENAAKYAGAASDIRVSVQQADDDLELRVDDDGPGIPAEHLEQIFDRFFRLATDTRVPGTGLGLPICRRIVEAHGGCIWAENRPEGGARFVVRLPAAHVFQASVV